MFFVVELRGMFMKNNNVMPYIDKSLKKVFEMNWCWWEVKFLHGVFMNISFFFSCIDAINMTWNEQLFVVGISTWSSL